MDQMIAGLKAGRTLCVDRRDAPELTELLEMEAQGLVESRLVEIDEQSCACRANRGGFGRLSFLHSEQS